MSRAFSWRGLVGIQAIVILAKIVSKLTEETLDKWWNLMISIKWF